MDLQLTNGTEIKHADVKLLRFLESEYELYDGIEAPHDVTLSLFDILLSVMMNSRLDTADKVRSIWKGKVPVEMALQGIPGDLALEGGDIPWDGLRTLFDAFCGIKWAGPAVATKILHKKRPHLIPIYDSVIACYLLEHNPKPRARGWTAAEIIVHDIQYFRELLLCSLDAVRVLSEMAGAHSFHVSPVRVLEILLWIDNEGMGHYMTCPQCAAERKIRIAYGMPTPQLERDAMSGRVWLGGCCVPGASPRWHCPQCGEDFGKTSH